MKLKTYEDTSGENKPTHTQHINYTYTYEEDLEISVRRLYRNLIYNSLVVYSYKCAFV